MTSFHTPNPPTTTFFLHRVFCKHNCFALWSLKALEVIEEMEGKKREGWMSVEPVGRSGAAPPVIIRVTAARARLCAACTRRDVLPREKSEHLSVPPRRQQPPTSLSNSTQLVTRSPNSYFLSLTQRTHTHTHTLCFCSCFCSLPLLQNAPLVCSLSSSRCESATSIMQCTL